MLAGQGLTAPTPMFSLPLSPSTASSSLPPSLHVHSIPVGLKIRLAQNHLECLSAHHWVPFLEYLIPWERGRA